MKTDNKKISNNIPAVNFHLWEPCNFRCKYCFATFKDVRKSILPKGHLPKEDALKIVDELALAGFTKITFAGGEPTLCKWLVDLIFRAKQHGMNTTIVTNGSGVTTDFLESAQNYLDWVAISIDSVNIETNKLIGRMMGNSINPDFNWYNEKGELIKQKNIKLKINTVVNQYNYNETDLVNLINKLEPKRWKIFQALSVKGQNDKYFDELAVTNFELEKFVSQNKLVNLNTHVVVENNENMRGSYVMVDPAGRFYDNTNGSHTYSKPILTDGVEGALNQINKDYQKFILRGGLYDWK
jgi:radical S-adenosyl methionine domain-containing protein 2